MVKIRITKTDAGASWNWCSVPSMTYYGNDVYALVIPLSGSENVVNITGP
jgi:hypothetical protein